MARQATAAAAVAAAAVAAAASAASISVDSICANFSSHENLMLAVPQANGIPHTTRSAVLTTGSLFRMQSRAFIELL